MKATELMIGDWVMYNPNVFIEDEYEPAKPCYPTQILSGEDIDTAIEGCYSPIPLTAEILERNGFKRSGTNYIMYDDYYDIVVHEISDSIWDVQYTNCEMPVGNQQMCVCHVHQLQHALRMCNIDKDIELWK